MKSDNIVMDNISCDSVKYGEKVLGEENYNEQLVINRNK